MKLTCDVPV